MARRCKKPVDIRSSFSQEEWQRGIALIVWAESQDPQTTSQLKENHVGIKSIPPDAEEERKNQLYCEALKRLRARLLEGIYARLFELRCRPTRGLLTEWKEISRQKADDIIVQIQFDRAVGCNFYDRNEPFEVRVFLPTELVEEHKKKSGRKPAVDRDEVRAIIHAMRSSRQGLPKTQARIEEFVANFLVSKYDDHTAVATIRKHVSEILAEIKEGR